MKQSSDNLSADVLIIGSGPIGSTYARILVEAGRDVLMVDAGAQLSPVPGSHLRNARAYQYNQNDFASVVTGNLHTLSIPTESGYQETLDKTAFWSKNNQHRNFHNPDQDPLTNLSNAQATYAVGGMFTHWTAATPRQHPTLERSPIITAKEWDELYDVAEFFFNTHTDQFEFDRNRLVKEALTQFYATAGAGYPWPITESDYEVQNLPMAAERREGFGDDDEYVHWTGVDTILGPLLTDPELTSRFRILPEHLITRLEFTDGRVTRAHAEDFNTLTTRTIEADVFIVATGAIFGPQLLHHSGIRHEALGRYLSDQIVASCLVVLSKELVASLGSGTPTDPINMPINAPEPEVWIPVSEGRPWHCQIHEDPINFTTPGGEYVDQRLLVFMQWFGMVEQEKDNCVSFNENIPDLMGLPQPTFHYVPCDAAAQRAHGMIQDMASATLSVGGWLPGQLPEFEPPGASLHFTGTTRMGETDDGTSVVDPYSRHWGFDNLYVGGCGVIPQMNACNPTLTAAAIAVRSARSIIEGTP